ncbi:SagB/ThcOx family dehydrogenase [Paenibacillus xerothermodurans]|uniref:SagB/ThcOx family dehydrogenase n=1 Tax=Paenibacillus xerothermodurans TaxID=1977292 RepID=A0A2W1NBT6_PAEXE|nr:SagB/ThcOx family dehydrogenase [Paenibacillus xerothermodurans]PZE20571.1 SagB/ThcOx family dehydrogenase [Paenibacillus xerothermodurans]
MHKDWEQICEQFIQATSYSPRELETMTRGRRYEQGQRPPTYLGYPRARVRVDLGEPHLTATPDLWEVIADRRSRRNFLDKPISLNVLNQLLWGTQGITADMGDYQLRTTPSAGALYPIETYLLVNNVEGLQKGLYHLNVKEWTLEGLKLEDVSELSYEFTLGQEMTKISAVNFVWTAMIPRTKTKYYERAYRYIWWDVGHIAQQLHILGNALQLGVCTIGAWYDSEVNKYLELDGRDHLSVLMAAVGQVEGEDWLEDRRPRARGK